jgi:hypothetical protein
MQIKQQFLGIYQNIFDNITCPVKAKNLFYLLTLLAENGMYRINIVL